MTIISNPVPVKSQLLYCNWQGVVVYTYDDDAVAVPISTYSNIRRIIPYDGDISALPPMGNPVIAYGEPAPTPYGLKRYAAQVRFDMIMAGFDFQAASGVIPVKTDRESYFLVTGLATWAPSVPPDTPVSFTQGFEQYGLSAAESIELFNAFTKLIQDCRAVEAQCVADLESASPALKTYDDVDQMFAGVGRGHKRAGG